jgi:hypothetical protein
MRCAAAELDVDKDDLKRYSDFVNDQIYDMFPKGLQESIHEFRELDHDIEVEPVLEQLIARPPLEQSVSENMWQLLPELAGGMSLALARTIRTIDPAGRTVHTTQWDRAFRIFDLLL